MLILRCDMPDCMATDTNTNIYSMSQDFKERYNFEDLEHICVHCLAEYAEDFELDGFEIFMGMLILKDECNYQEVDR